MSPQPFPGLKPLEGMIWAAFLQAHGPEWDRFDYNVHVGQGHPLDPNWPDFLKVMVAKVSTKKIDAVGWKGGQPTLFEISPKAGPGSWGHLLQYHRFFREDFPQVPAPALAYVVPFIMPDDRRYLEGEGITIYLVQGVLPGT